MNINIYFLMGGARGGAGGLWSHLSESSIFKRSLIEKTPTRLPTTPHPAGIFLTHHPPRLRDGDFPPIIRRWAGVTRCLQQVRQVHVQYNRAGNKKKMDCSIYLSARTAFAGLNLSFFSETEKERRSEGRASGRNAMGGGGGATLT